MIQYLIVTARNHPDLYGYLRRQFAGDEKVQVLLDRRHEERRRQGDLRKPDRRKGDRRGGRGTGNGLTSHGFVVIRQFSGVQWRPPWWGPDMGDVRADLEKRAGLANPKHRRAESGGELVDGGAAPGRHRPEAFSASTSTSWPGPRPPSENFERIEEEARRLRIGTSTSGGSGGRRPRP